MNDKQKTEEQLLRVAGLLFANGEVDLALLLIPQKPNTEKNCGRV